MQRFDGLPKAVRDACRKFKQIEILVGVDPTHAQAVERTRRSTSERVGIVRDGESDWGWDGTWRAAVLDD